jgi:RNA polymerase sigma-70 factor (ECF subfamily)
MYVMMGRIGAAAAVEPHDDAFVALYERTVGDIYSYLRSRANDRGVAEDLTQDVFVVGAHRVAAGEPVDLPWLIGVARHKLVDHWRAQARADRNLALAHSLTHDRVVEAPDLDPGTASLVLARLNATYRTALVLRHVDGLSVGEVAAHLGRSVEATEQVLTRARAVFRSEYQEIHDA